MINRTVVRTRTIQTLFAFYNDGDKTPLMAKKDLIRSFSDTYSLYMLLLDFVNQLTRYAEDRIAEARVRAKATHQDYEPSLRFVENAFAQQVFENRTLRQYIESNKLTWDAGLPVIEDVYCRLIEAPFYKEYMAAKETNYEEDKKIWRKIFTTLLQDSGVFYTGLEEMELRLDAANWTTDADYIISFVIKTIKRFKQEAEGEQELLPMFESEDELRFAKDLLSASIEHHDEYAVMIDAHLKNWEANRIANMDRIILTVALAEIIHFPTIALEVSFNEYIELAKEYSSEKSYLFINGILNEIVKEQHLDLKRIKKK